LIFVYKLPIVSYSSFP